MLEIIFISVFIFFIIIICIISKFLYKEEEFVLQKTDENIVYIDPRKLDNKEIEEIIHLLRDGIQDRYYKAGRGKRLLYYARVTYENKTYYKIGVTSNSFEKRFNGRFGTYENIELIRACELPKSKSDQFEKDVLDYFHPYKVLNREVFAKKSGWTEVFNHDVLELDKGTIDRYLSYYERDVRKDIQKNPFIPVEINAA